MSALSFVSVRAIVEDARPCCLDVVKNVMEHLFLSGQTEDGCFKDTTLFLFSPYGTLFGSEVLKVTHEDISPPRFLMVPNSHDF